MRIVLHIGQQKTGSTALQYGLTVSHGDLARRGILYPLLKSRRGGRDIVAHHLLAVGGDFGSRFAERLVGTYPQYGTADAFAAVCAHIEAQIAQHRPETLVLSSECFFRSIASSRMCAWLKSLSHEIEVVAYLRSPPEFYIGMVQQRLRAGATELPQPKRDVAESVLDSYRRIFARVDARGYSNSDVVVDFTRRHLGIELHGRRVNAGMSAEAMAALLHLNRGGLIERGLGGVIEFAMDDGSKAKLRPDVVLPVREIADICVVDEARKEAMIQRGLRTMSEMGRKRLLAARNAACYPELTFVKNSSTPAMPTRLGTPNSGSRCHS